MNAKEILDDRVKRMEIQKTFRDRLDNYPQSHAKFCDEIGLAYSTMSRLLALQYAAGWKLINQIESGLKKNGL